MFTAKSHTSDSTHGLRIPQILENKVQSSANFIEGASEWQKFTTLLRTVLRLAEKCNGED